MSRRYDFFYSVFFVSLINLGSSTQVLQAICTIVSRLFIRRETPDRLLTSHRGLGVVYETALLFLNNMYPMFTDKNEFARMVFWGLNIASKKNILFALTLIVIPVLITIP